MTVGSKHKGLDYYRILEIHPQASKEVIEKAFKTLSMKYHPDRHPSEKQAWATSKMQEINEAYAVLTDPIKRANYSRSRQREATRIFLDEGIVGLVRRFWSRQP